MLKKIKKTVENINSLLLYPKIHAELSKKRNLYFFFPSWAFGGAERVHIEIMELFKDPKPLCLITERSINEGFKKEFESVADTINLGRWAEKKPFKKHLFKKLAKTINAQQNPVVSGWCSKFMYELLPLLDPHVKVIDIIHNFMDDAKGIELYTIPYVPRLNGRIVVGKGLVDQFRVLYKENNVPEKYLDRITVIQNKIAFDNTFPEKNYDGTLQILFVARNSPEKRPDVFIRVAELCDGLRLPVEFKMIGNFKSGEIPVPTNTEIIGEIHDKHILNNYYKNSHLLLLTSHRESWGLVIFEGMNFGVVPIATNVGELSHYISVESQSGILIENLSQKDELANLFVQKIQSFCSNRSLLKKFSKNSFEKIKQLSEECDFNIAYKNTLSGKQL